MQGGPGKGLCGGEPKSLVDPQVTQYVEGALEVGRGEQRRGLRGLGAAGRLNSVQ